MTDLEPCEHRSVGTCDQIARHGRCQQIDATVTETICRECMEQWPVEPEKPTAAIATTSLAILRGQRGSRQVRHKILWLQRFVGRRRHILRPCRHRRDIVGSLACRTCTGGGTRTVYECDVHGTCTDRPMTPADPKESRPHPCLGCDEHQPVEIGEPEPLYGPPCVHRGPGLDEPGLFACERLGRCFAGCVDIDNIGDTENHDPRVGLQDCAKCELRRVSEPVPLGPDAARPRQTERVTEQNNSQGFLVDRLGRSADCLRDMYAGEPCVLVCGGPSLEAASVDRLQARGILLAAVNNAGATAVRPQLWFSCDQQCHFQEAIWRDAGITKFAARSFSGGRLATRRGGQWVFSETKAADCPATYFYKRSMGMDPDTFLTSPVVVWGGKYPMPGGRERECKSVMLVALRLLFWLGVRTVYLVGCDFKMEAGKSYGFDERKAPGGAGSNNTSYGILKQWLADLRPHFDAAKYSVYNCNPDSHLEAFEHRSLDEAIADCTSVIPETIVTRGMYGFN